ncbi:MAG: FecR family protein [Spirochaetaceae bacterium]|jgi:hypothetical protein|nr:FecR family protein [Spirochaetaceae bacterium]
MKTLKALFTPKTLWFPAALFCAAALSAQSPRAVIQEVRGTVEIKRPGASAWAPAAAGQELSQDTHISTGFKSSALIRLGNSTLTVQPLTRLSLAEIRAADAGRVSVQLQAGRIRADVKPPAEGPVQFTVRSPTATASVRGTVFEFDTVNLTVDEGTVGFSGPDGAVVYVRAGQSSSPDPITGRAAAPVGTAEAQAAPLPAGTETIAVSVDVIPGPASSEVRIGVSWD